MITSMLVLGENVVDDARLLAAATGLILRLPAWVISAFQSAQPRPGADSSDRLNYRPRLTR